MTRIRTFLFDLGNVLVHFSHERMWQQLAALCGRSAAELQSLIQRNDLADDYERGRFSETEFHTKLQDLTGARFEQSELQRAVADIFELNPPMLPLLERLRTGGHRLVLLSNTNESHVAWVQEQFDVLQHFDDLVLSCRVGAMKPEPEIYEAALQVIQCRPDECFYTDDIVANVEKGRDFGLQAELFTDSATLVDQLRQRGVNLVG